VALDRPQFARFLDECLAAENLEAIRGRVSWLVKVLGRPGADPILGAAAGPDGVLFCREVLSAELEQIHRARTLQRARYYLRRLQAGIGQAHTSSVNDINLNRWKEYGEVLTDSLWLFGTRDTSGAHLGWYWGNFVPQIPHQLMLRYTKRGEWVLDPFVGSGTTLIECRRLDRNGLGVELNPEVASRARELIAREPNPCSVVSDLVVGDSTALDFGTALRERGVSGVHLLLMHPPYHDIIRFSEDPRDLSNAPSVQEFLGMFGQVVEQTYPALERGRYLAVVIGDKYTRGEWIPLGFYTMQEVLRRGYLLKSIVVKNFEETRAKREQKELWRYRALAGGFYVFKHEYILIFRK